MDTHDFPPEIYTEWAVGVTPASNHIPFGIDASGAARDASAVENGLKCGCACPSCGGELVARQGEVRVHHFAHHSKTECRHALEASLFRGTLAALSSPGMRLRLPPLGDRRQLAQLHGAVLDGAAAKRFFANPWVVGPVDLNGARAEIVVHDLAQSTVEAADLRFPDQGISVHLLSHRKDAHQVRAALGPDAGLVLGLDLRFYASLWWETCDRDRAEKVVQASESLRRWLWDGDLGKGWLSHPEFEAKAARMREWTERHPRPEPAPRPAPVPRPIHRPISARVTTCIRSA